MSSHALTTVETVKTYLGIPAADTSKDEFFKILINAASERIEKYCGRHFEKANYTEKYRGNNRQLLRLNQYPIISVALVKINGSTLDPSDYEILPAEGMLYRESLWSWSGYVQGLVGEPVGSVLNIEVQYTAGYILPKDENLQTSPPVVRTLPYDLELACIAFVAYIYGGRDGAGKASEQQGAWQVEYAKLTLDANTLPLPPEVMALCEGYRRLVVA